MGTGFSEKVNNIRGIIMLLSLVYLFSGCVKENYQTDDPDSVDFVPATAIMRIEEQFLYEYEYRYFYALRYGTLATENEFDEDAMKDAVLYKAKAVLAEKAELFVDENEVADIEKKAEVYLQYLYESGGGKEFQSEDEEAFLEYYYGITKEEYLKIYYNLYAGGEYELYLSAGIAQASDEEIENRYNQNPDKYRSVEIMYAYFEIETDEISKVSEIESALSDVKASEEMSVFIAENSQIYGANENGGSYTYYHNDAIFPEFDDFCSKENLKSGEKDVVVVDGGVYAVFCDCVNDLSSETVRTEIAEIILQEKTQERLTEEIARLEIAEV
jgi:hypothetical protein